MDVRSPLFQNIACILMGVMFLNPIVSTAAELTVDAAAGANTNLGSAQNGVPVVNIATPNGSGLSHNKFTDYNVGQQGLILNNGTAAFNQTQLGGVILGNSNLNGRAANLILNEVTGGNQSQLKGYTEVAGQGAHVVVANPHGITCDGCGFINTPRATLTTGTPVIDNGRLDHYDVNGGEINVEGAGLNASNISQFDLITRSAKLNAQLQAQQLNIIAGRNDVDATTLAATAKADDGSTKPLLAIDSSALGGMYAGAIRLVGTEAGVGVKLAADMAASGGDIQIDANGKLTVARVAGAANVQATAQHIELTDTVYAGNNATLTAGQIDVASTLVSGANMSLNGGTLNNNGTVNAGGNLTTDLQQLNNSGKKVLAVGNATVKATAIDNRSGQLVAQQNLTVIGDNLDNRAGTLASNKALSLTLAATLNNSADGLLLSKADGLTLNAHTFNNVGGTAQADGNALTIVSTDTNNTTGTLQADSVNITATGTLTNDNGRIAATQDQATFTAGAISNQAGTVLAKTTVKVDAASLNNTGGTLGANHVDLALTGHLNNDNGLIESSTTLLLNADSLTNNGGKLRALGTTGTSQFALGGLFNNDGGLVEIGNSQLTLTGASLSNQSGNLRHLGTQGFALALADVGNAGGSFITNGELNLNVANWTNTSDLQAQKITLNVGTFTQTATGKLRSVDSITATGDTWQNDGSIETDGALNLTLSGAYSGNGSLLSQGDLTVTAASVDTGVDSQWKTGGKADFTVGGNLVNRGKISAAQNLIARANSLNNYGTLGAATTLRVEAVNLLNDSGLIFSGADMALRTNSFTNRLADVYSLGALSIAKDDSNAQLSLLENRSGSIESTGDMSLRAAVFTNRKDVFRTENTQTYGQVAIVCYDCGGDNHNVDYVATERFETTVAEDSAAARISSGANLDIQGGVLTNQYSTIATTGVMTITGTSLENIGASTGTIERVRRFNTGRVSDGTDERFRDAYVYPYNAQGFPKVLPSAYARWTVTSDIQTETPTGIAAPAVIQAGGNITIQATQPITNASVLANQAPQLGAAQNLDTNVASGTQPLVVQLNPQLPPDAAQQGVNPITLPSFSLPQGQNGLFHVNTDSSHPYLVESNPAFASLRNFISSDYLLGIIGYNADLTQRRLGDGLYEQRLVQDAIVARTGKRFLDGLASDEAQFKYLMDNAIASKTALNLVPGIALSAEQVAALTHDIVWMQEQVVNGQKVLVPVLYLAQATDRLAPTGALIQGRDVALISGSALTNSGTLRANNNLTANATNITNSGLTQANERLSLLATDSVRNAQGGILKGKDVAVVAVAGDVTNQRNIATDSRSGKNFSQQTSVVDSAARIEAGNNLVLSAGRDIQNIGGAISAGGNADISAGRDLVIAAAEAENGQMRKDKHHFWETSSTTQYASDVKVGGDLDAGAGRDLTVVASNVKATGDIYLGADRDVTLAAAANTAASASSSKGHGKRSEKQSSQVSNQAAVIEAGGDVNVSAGQDLAIIGSKVKAANDVVLEAERDTTIASVKDESASYSFKSKKGSFGRSSSKQSERYDSTNVASVIEAGNDLSINTTKAADGSMSIDGGRDVTVIGSQLSAGNDMTIGATGDVAILSGVEEHGSYSKKTKSGFLGLSKSGKSQMKTSASQVASELNAENDVVIAAGNDLRLRASQTTAGNDVELRSGLVNPNGDINLVSANDTAYSKADSYKKKVGMSGSDFVGLMSGSPSWGGDLTVAASKKTGQEAMSSTSVGSQVTADRDATLVAERDINVVGSGVSGGRNVLLDAGRDVNVVASSNSQQTTSWKNTKTVGMQQKGDDNGFSTFVGEEKLKKKNINSQETAAASQIDAGWDLNVKAGRDVVQQGSDMSASNDITMQAGRNIVIDAAGERTEQTRIESQERDGTTTRVNHNFGSTKDAISGVGKGENTVSQASSVLKAADAINQFFGGPTGDVHGGKSSVSETSTHVTESNRGSTLSAGNDVSLQANEAVVVRGGSVDAGRDINVKGRDVTFTVAQGAESEDSQQKQSKGGMNAGTTGGWKVGVGASSGTADQESRQGTSSGAQLDAGRDINLEATNDLSLIGTNAQSGRDINLKAGNDLLVGAAGNPGSSNDSRHSGGGEVGLTVGTSGLGVYVSVDIGKGKLERESTEQQEAYLYAGRDVKFESGRDTTIAGAKLEGEDVTGKVGRNLTVSSVPDTGKVSGKEYDASLTVTVGYGASVSGSVGYGETNGKKDWVGNQTSVIARDKLDIRTEDHTQIDGAVIASQTGSLTLDTDTLGFRDIKGEDKEHGYYVNAGGSYGTGQQDTTQVGKGEEGKNSWSVEGYDYNKEREQIVRATVGAGAIVVRNDAGTGEDSTVGLNRDLNKAYEVTKDEEERTDLYVSKSSLESAADPEGTLKEWSDGLQNYDQTTINNIKQIGVGFNVAWNRLQIISGKDNLPAGAAAAGGKEIADRLKEALLLSGMSAREADAMLGNEAFQNDILKSLYDIANTDPREVSEVKTALVNSGVIQVDAQGNPIAALAPTDITLSGLQKILTSAANMNAYIEDNPGKAKALGIALALVQGPKGVMQLAVQMAVGETEIGQSMQAWIEQWQNQLNKAIAEKLEGRDLEPEEDHYLIGGGGLIGDILSGGVGGWKGKPKSTISVREKNWTREEHSSNSVENGSSVTPGSGKNGDVSVLPGNQTVAQFEKSLVSLPPGERVAQIKTVAATVTAKNGMIKDSKLSKLNGRDVYLGVDGKLYALDTQHGRFEVLDSKNGKHLGEVNFDLSPTKPADKTGGHDIRMK